MCGIAGLLDTGRATPAAELQARARAMARTLAHRGPDGEGVWADAAAGVAFGHRRLAVLDLSAAGAQPMRSADGRYTITYNGELYDHRALRAELAGAGWTFRGSSDTEVLLAAIGAHGLEGALARSNGMFAFALWDARERALHLVRDRLGEKPLYYGWAGPAFVFASELKALRAHPGFTARVDRDALALYLRHSCVPSPRSILDGVATLPPGTVLTLTRPRPGDLPAPRPWWTLRSVVEQGRDAPFTGDEREAADELDRLVRDAVRLRMASDVPLGAFLSGGIDSSTVVAAMQAASSRPVRTFTIGMKDDRVDEAEDAAAVARHLGTEHEDVTLTPAEAQDVVPRLPDLYDEPFADPSQIPTALVAEVAGRSVTVALSGDGGDEVLAGYNRHTLGDLAWRSARRVPRPLRALASRALLAPAPATWDRLVGAAGPVLPRSLHQRSPGDKLHKLAALLPARGPHDVYLALASTWPDPAALVPGAREPLTAVTDAARRPDLDDPVAAMQYLDGVLTLPDDMLVKVDRASMAVGLEVRVPLLDHRIVAFAWSLPADLKIRDGQGKWLLRRVLDRSVPRALVDRPKVGFDPPLGDWLRDPLRDWAEDLLAGPRLAEGDLLDPAPVRRAWAEHLAGRRNHDYRLWAVLAFQSWRARWAT